MRTLFLLTTAATLLTATAPALADTPGRGWISAKRATTILQRRGYRVTSIEADDGHWEGRAMRRNRAFEFHVDPLTGRITKLEPDN